jgi:uncharacterized iron-regulated membrane protein
MLLYVIGGVVTAAGALTATMWLLRLTGRSSWPGRRAAAHASPPVSPGARRQGLNRFWCSVVLTVDGILLILSAHSDTAARIGIVTGSALLLWQLGGEVVSRRQHRSAT